MLPPLRLTFKRAMLLAGPWARGLAAAVGLTPARADLMILLWDSPQLQRDIIRELCVSAPVVSRMLKALKTLGFVSSRRQAGAGCLKVVELTSEGRTKLAPLFDDVLALDGERGTVQDSAELLVLDFVHVPLTQAGSHTHLPFDGDLRDLLPSLIRAVRATDVFDFHIGEGDHLPIATGIRYRSVELRGLWDGHHHDVGDVAPAPVPVGVPCG